MKSVKPADLERQTRLDPAVRFTLLTGPDEATMEAVAVRLIGLAGKEAERLDLTGSQLAQDPSLLAAEAASMSLFSPARIIKLELSGSGDDSLAAVEALLAAETAINPVIATGASVTAKSKLVKLVEGSDQAVAAICYQPDRRALVGIAMAAAQEQGLRIANSEAQLLVDLVSGDQALMRREIEKIALYLDAGPDRQRQVTPADIAALGAATHEEDVSECINVALGGRVRDLPEMLAKAAAVGVAEIRIIRALAIRALALARLRAEVDGGAHPATVVSARSSGIFWKERDAVTAQLHIWDSVRIARLMSRLLDCERALKASGTAGGVLFRKLMTDIAHQAARAR
ncbi:DNA polymerase III subunit delta [Sphingopyxis sp. SE2]|jgi:DNA polymerase-3 subunit delta|uniref:DNA polymerase III subunit delta n=1 Tax=unclassified Sphingopyxis TaxID=2614943 RepID=UPI00050DEF16|nr:MULTISPECIES: DNA polymerase III subunit delta [unclassified Sphingopyxis]KGB56172.1 DNA polymerase III subunit delta [Sphingopyxis sp. LC363]MDT7530249.1 DNA polymerase III subunit delta [Sphingopyxis sp. SE2]